MAGGSVGSVYITVRAITDKVSADIEKAFAGVNTGSVAASGEGVAKAFNSAVNKGVNANIFNKVGESLSNFGGEAGSAREKLFELTRTGYITGTALASLLGAVSSLIGGLGGLIGAVGGAIPAMMGLLGAVISVKAGMAVGQLALEGVSQAVQKAITQTQQYTMTQAQLQKQTIDLAFASENASNAVGRAGLDLEKARNNLLRMQDLPPNSLQRREAMQSYKEAETAYRQAKARAADAKKEAKNPMAFKTPKSDPYAGLTPAQKDFAKWLVSMHSQFQDLKDAAASGFLPILKTNLETIIAKVLPTFKAGIHDIAVGLGGLTTNLTAAITDPGNVKLLGQVMHNIAGDLPLIGKILGSVYGVFLSILDASHPLVTDFLKFLNTKVKGLDEWMKTEEGKKKMKDFFAGSERIMKDLGTIFENTLGGIGAIIGANFEPGSGGDIMLQWLKKVTGNWAAMDDTVKGKNALKQYFIDTANNSTKILDAVGALVKNFLALGANPNIGKTFEALSNPDAVKAAQNIGTSLVDAGPSLGKLVADLTIFIDKMTDSKAISNFFDTIDGAVRGLNDLFKNPAIDNFFKLLGQIHGVIFGIVGISKVAGFGFKVMGDTYKAFGDAVGAVPKFFQSTKIGIQDTSNALGMIRWPEKNKLADAFAIGKSGGSFKQGLTSLGNELDSQMSRMVGTTKTAFGNMGQSTNIFTSAIGKAGLFLMANPMVAAIGLIVGAMVLLYNNSKEFRDFVDTAFKQIGQIFSDTWGAIQAALKPAMDAFDELFKTLGIDTAGAKGSPLVVFFEAIVNIVKVVIAALAAVVTYLVGQFARGITATVSIFSGFIKIIKGITDLIGAFFKALTTGKWDDFAKAADKAFQGMKAGAMQIFAGIVNFFIDGINNGIKLANDISKNISTATGGAVKLGTIPLVPKWVPKMAKGGTVLPSPGGSLINVAEAGRPERIEPLDSNGLSNRDKALIDFLSGGAAGKSIQMNIYPSAGMDERELAAAVSRQLAFELRKGGI